MLKKLICVVSLESAALMVLMICKYITSGIEFFLPPWICVLQRTMTDLFALALSFSENF
jgi:hypothetical protein